MSSARRSRATLYALLVLLSTAIHFPVAGSEDGLIALARPTPLSPTEAALPAVAELARRFNPAMVLPIPEVWPVEVRYAWHDGADLVAEVDAGSGQPARRWTAWPSAELGRRDWSGLPHQLPDGRAIRYYLDAPGDDRPGPGGLSGWRRRFRDITGAGPPERSPYPPTQYAHPFWWHRERGLLAIQYWFYYPFNEWVNHHEADWEHVIVVLEGVSHLDDRAALAGVAPLGHLYFFHDSWLEPRQLVELAGDHPGARHPVVFVGGHGQMFAWSGSFSGGSYPLPGRYPRAGFEPRFLAPDEEVSIGTRFLAPEQFQVIVLPEPGRLDAGRHPELSWLRLPVHAGQRRVHHNPIGYATFDRDHPPVQPGVRPSWLAPPTGAAYDDPLPTGGFDQATRALPASWRSRRPLPPATSSTNSDRANG